MEKGFLGGKRFYGRNSMEEDLWKKLYGKNSMEESRFQEGQACMYEWNETTQRIIDWIEAHICDTPTLLEISEYIGYSPFYCSTQFHKVTGRTIKSYIAARRLALAALALRDSDARILDIAVRYGYSSQEALTRAFSAAFGCTPASYRKKPVPIPLPIRQVVYLPEHYQALKGAQSMSSMILTAANVRVEFIPAHKYMGIWDEAATNYGEFWQKHDCDTVCGIVDSMSHACDMIISGHTAGWKRVNGELRYFYGTGLPADYTGPVREGFEIRDIPASYYLVFFHPVFDYLKDNGEVMGRVEQLAWNYDIEKEFQGGKYTWNEEVCPCYQRHYPEVLGYQILRPIKRKV